MGIKDWFGGDKKKEAFREVVKDAVADGRLDAKDLKTAIVSTPEGRVIGVVMRRALGE